MYWFLTGKHTVLCCGPILLQDCVFKKHMHPSVWHLGESKAFKLEAYIFMLGWKGLPDVTRSKIWMVAKRHIKCSWLTNFCSQYPFSTRKNCLRESASLRPSVLSKGRAEHWFRLWINTVVRHLAFSVSLHCSITVDWEKSALLEIVFPQKDIMTFCCQNHIRKLILYQESIGSSVLSVFKKKKIL